MARPRYPSDTNRGRPSVRVHLTWQNHPRFAEVAADPTLRGVVVGIWMIAMRAFASRTQDTVTLTCGDIDWITGGDPALLRRACELMGYPISEGTRCSRVKIRNFAKKQGIPPQNYAGDSARLRGNSSESESESDSSSYSGSSSSSSTPENTREEGGAGGGSPAPKTPPAPRVSDAEFNLTSPEEKKPNGKKKPAVERKKAFEISDDEMTKLIAWGATTDHGEPEIRHAVEVVRAWALAGSETKVSWYAAVQGAVLRGWGVEGYKPPNAMLTETGELYSEKVLREERERRAAEKLRFEEEQRRKARRAN